MTSDAARLLPRSVLLVNLEVDQANRRVSENVLQVEVVSHGDPAPLRYYAWWGSSRPAIHTHMPKLISAFVLLKFIFLSRASDIIYYTKAK